MVGARPGNRSILFVFLLMLAIALAGCQAQDADDEDTPTADDSAVEEPASDVSDDSALEETPAADEDESGDDTRSDAAEEESTPEADDSVADESDYPITVTRTDGIELTIEQPAERIISLSPGATEVFFEIGAVDQVYAVDMFSDYPPETEDYPRLDAYQPDPEAIVDMDPDLVFVVYDADGIVEVLDDLDVPTLFLDAPSSLDELVEQIRLLGNVTGNVDQAQELGNSIEQRIEDISERVAEIDENPKVYHELDDTFFTVGPDSFVGDLYNILQAENIADGAMGDYPQLSEEIILEEDPDVIILPGYGEEGAVEAVGERAGWDVISAVENDRIYEIDGDIVSRPGPRIVEALEQLAEMLYPEEFSSFNGFTIGQIHSESPTSAF